MKDISTYKYVENILAVNSHSMIRWTRNGPLAKFTG